MWKNIKGQKRVINILKNIYKSDRIPHSFIFHGIEGIGKDAAAIEFAKLLNCDNPEVETGSCDKCRSCKQMSLLNSANIKFIIPLPSSKKESDENESQTFTESDFEILNAELKNKSLDPYHKIDIPKANSIKIESIRQIKKEIYLTGERSKKKVYIISNADMMRREAANSFLKVLEEPPGDALIILTTAKINSLLPTIVGRCQKVKFDAIGSYDLKNYIYENHPDTPNEEINLLVNLSNGSLQTLKNILNCNFLELREKGIDHLRAIVANKYLSISKIITSIVSTKDRDLVKQYLYLMQLWFRDIIIKKSQNDDRILNKDKDENIKNFVSRLNCDEYEIINLLEMFISDIDKNVNLELLLYNLTYKLKPMIKNI
jgi:DNA polymerase-3 subunit delta'